MKAYQSAVLYKQSACCSQADNLSKCLQDGIKDLIYYAGLNYKPTLEITEVCNTCGGDGTVRKTRSMYGTKPCPDCKGKNSRTVIASFPVIIRHIAFHKKINSPYETVILLPCEIYWMFGYN